MKRKVIHDYDLRNAKLLAETECAIVLRLNNGNIFKFLRSNIIQQFKLGNVDIEAKILDAQPIKQSPEILVPSAAAYSENGVFCGYIMPSAVGIDYNTYNDNLTILQHQDLKKYADIHSKLEKVLRRNTDIVFPDFCTCDNIYVDGRGNVQFIDYDGLQVGKHKSLSFSSNMGDAFEYIKPKYFTEDMLFTKELDKKSSIMLYFLSTFNVDLKKVGTINPENGLPITLDDVFETIKLDDLDVCHKVWKTFQDNQSNDFLGDDVFRIAEKYDMNVVDSIGSCYCKELSKKR